MDTARFPRAAKYLESLPEGLASFPTCTVRSTVFDPQVKAFSHLSTEPSFPAEVAALLAGRLSNEPWTREVVFQVAYLAVRDVGFADDALFDKWIFEINRELFERPLLRSLMRLVSPSLVVLGAAKRWSAFHAGTELVPGNVDNSSGRSETLSRLKFPPLLFGDVFLKGLEQSFLAALTMAKARDPSVTLVDVQPGLATYRARWTR